MTEALERLFLSAFLQNRQAANVQVAELFNKSSGLEEGLTDAKAEEVMSSSEINELFASFEHYKQKVHNGDFGKTQQFWMLYMDLVWHLMNLSLATRTNYLELYISSMKHLCPLLFSMNHPNYAKYLIEYYILILNLPAEVKDTLRNNGFSVSTFKGIKKEVQ